MSEYIGTLAQSHTCQDGRVRRLGRQWVWDVDRAHKTSVDLCQWCGEQFPRDDGEVEFFIWSMGYNAAKGDITNAIMRQPTPDTVEWRKVYPKGASHE